jgi:hypothetical protein
MQWPNEKGQNDKQWSIKKLHRKLKIEQHESHLKPGRNSVGDNLSLQFYIVWQFQVFYDDPPVPKLSQRFLRHFAVFHCPYPGKDELQTVFSTLLHCHFILPEASGPGMPAAHHVDQKVYL